MIGQLLNGAAGGIGQLFGGRKANGAGGGSIIELIKRLLSGGQGGGGGCSGCQGGQCQSGGCSGGGCSGCGGRCCQRAKSVGF